MSRRSREISGKIVKGLSKFASALANNEPIAEMFTCRKVTLDLRPIPYNAKTVKTTRKLLRVSQAVFAQFLGVDVSTVQKWEQGRQVPCDMACRFMDEIQRDPDYWRNRLRGAFSVKVGC